MTLHARLIARSTLAACLASSAALASPPAQIVVPGTNLATESITSTADGTVIIGSMNSGIIFRAKPGAAKAEPWIRPGPETGLMNVLGVLAQGATNTLWACSFSAGSATASPAPTTLHAFDLTTGAPKGKWSFPTPGGLCNDIAIGPDGSAYVTDSNNMQIVRLPKGGKAIEVWAGNGAFGPKDALLDGIAVVGHTVVVNTLQTSKLFSVPIGPRGEAGAVTEVRLDQPIAKPDGQRRFGDNGILIVESGAEGRLSHIVFEGEKLDSGKVTRIKMGFPDDPVSVTMVGETAYVLEAQWDAAKHPPKPFKATAVHVGAR